MGVELVIIVLLTQPSSEGGNLSQPTHMLGSMDYILGSEVFGDSQRVRLQPDDVGNTAFGLEPTYDHSTPGSNLCTRDWEPNFSILIKFKPPPGTYALTFLNITSPNGIELAVTLDTCSNNVTIAFNQRCGSTKISLPYRALDMRTGPKGEPRWNRLTLRVSPDFVAMYLNCQPQQAVSVNLEGCHVQCEDSVVTVIHPAAATESQSCNAGVQRGRQVSYVAHPGAHII